MSNDAQITELKRQYDLLEKRLHNVEIAAFGVMLGSGDPEIVEAAKEFALATKELGHNKDDGVWLDAETNEGLEDDD